MKCWLKVNNLTCIVDEDVQSGFSFQEDFSKTANRLETSKIQLHEHHLVTVTLLWDILKNEFPHMSRQNKEESRLKFSDV